MKNPGNRRFASFNGGGKSNFQIGERSGEPLPASARLELEMLAFRAGICRNFFRNRQSLPTRLPIYQVRKLRLAGFVWGGVTPVSKEAGRWRGLLRCRPGDVLKLFTAASFDNRWMEASRLMKRIIKKWFVGIQVACVALAGCHPTQPYFIRERGQLAHYLDQAQKIEIPDMEIDPIPEATQTFEPITLDNQKFEFLDLTLEECVSYALANAKILQTLPGYQRQSFDIPSVVLSSPTQQLASIYDPAIAATTTNSQPIVVDGNGNRILPRGAARANQVGGVEDALSEFDAQASSFMSYNNTDRARNVVDNFFNRAQFRGDDGTAQLAISKRMATGGVVTARSQSIYSFNNIPAQIQNPGNLGRVIPSDYTQILEAQVLHPLMRNRGTLVNRIPVVLARINEDVSLVQFEERVRNLVRDVEYAYWDLYQAYWNVENARIARDSAAQAYHIAFEKSKKGLASTTEAQARVTFHEFQAQLDAALGGSNLLGQDPGLFGREQSLRLLLGWAATDGRLIRPSDKPTIGLVEFDFYDSLDETLYRNVDLRRFRWTIKQQELELVSAKNQMLPEVNISLLYRWLGVGGSWLGKGGEGPFPPNLGADAPSAWEELLSGDYQEGAIRLDFVPNPVGARRAHADVRNKQLQLAKSHAGLEQAETAASYRLTQTLRELNSNYAQMTEQLALLSAAQRLVQLFQEKFNVGDSNPEQTIDLLLRAQQQRANAGRNYARALSEYNKSITDVHMVKGSLLEYNNIRLEEGMWQDKAYWDAHERARERDAARFLDYGASRPKVISRGELEQNLGTANAPAKSGAKIGSGIDRPATTPSPEPELVPPVKQATANSPAKFDWGQ
jgi:outer membrane protein TolC